MEESNGLGGTAGKLEESTILPLPVAPFGNNGTLPGTNCLTLLVSKGSGAVLSFNGEIGSSRRQLAPATPPGTGSVLFGTGGGPRTVCAILSFSAIFASITFASSAFLMSMVCIAE